MSTESLAPATLLSGALLEIGSVVETPNSVYFDFDHQTFLYERLCNTIHAGTRTEIEQLAAKIDKILYVPDYVINAGGLINVAHELKGYKAENAMDEARGIFNTLTRVFQDADKRNIPTHQASNEIAERRIAEAKSKGGFLEKNFNNQDWIRV